MSDIVAIPGPGKGWRKGGRMHLPAVLKIVQEHGPVSADEIAKIGEIPAASVRYTIQLARSKELIHVADYDRHVGKQGRWANLYSLGKKKDATPPVNDQAQYFRQYYERKRAGILMKRRAHDQAKVGKPAPDRFAHALQIFQIGNGK
jgi:predicted ArsR family transcriptional regulator